MWKAYLALFIVNVIYGANNLIAKGVMPDLIGPSGFVVARAFGACTLFWIFGGPIKSTIERKDQLRLVLCALFGVALNQNLYLHGLNLTSPIDTPIIMTSTPVMVVIFSYFILKEKITKNKLWGILLGSAGAIILIILGSTGTASKNSSMEGNLFILANAMSYSIYLVLVKPLMSRYEPLVLIKWIFLYGLILVIPIGVTQFFEVDWTNLPRHGIVEIGYVIFATTFLTYLLNIFALKKVSPSVSGSFIYFQPVVAMAFAFIHTLFSVQNYQGDITIEKAGCTILVFAGVYLISKR